MWNDFKKGFWYSVGALVGIWTLQMAADKISAKVVEKNMEDEEDSE